MGRHAGRWLRGRWHLLGGLLLLAYFAWHGVSGDRGLAAWAEKSRALDAARERLAALEGEFGAAAARVEALQPDRADADLLEEQLRELGWIGEGEVIVLPRGGPTPAR